jgi:hypothetical protein
MRVVHRRVTGFCAVEDSDFAQKQAGRGFPRYWTKMGLEFAVSAGFPGL